MKKKASCQHKRMYPELPEHVLGSFPAHGGGGVEVRVALRLCLHGVPLPPLGKGSAARAELPAPAGRELLKAGEHGRIPCLQELNQTKDESIAPHGARAGIVYVAIFGPMLDYIGQLQEHGHHT
jgi:hypothetical protein